MTEEKRVVTITQWNSYDLITVHPPMRQCEKQVDVS